MALSMAVAVGRGGAHPSVGRGRRKTGRDDVGEGKDRHLAGWGGKQSGGPGGAEIGSGSGVGDAGSVQVADGVRQSGGAVIQGVVVGQADDIDMGEPQDLARERAGCGR